MWLKMDFPAGLLAIVCAGLTQSAGADNLKIPDFYAEPGRSAGRAYVNGIGDETVDPFSGGLSIRYRDILLPGDGGMDIVVNRVYHSLQGVEPHLERRQERNVVGIGWDIHFGRV